MINLYKWLVNSARWHDLGHLACGFTAGVLGPWVCALWVVSCTLCDIFIDGHALNSLKLWQDLSTKILSALLGLAYYYYIKS